MLYFVLLTTIDFFTQHHSIVGIASISLSDFRSKILYRVDFYHSYHTIEMCVHLHCESCGLILMRKACWTRDRYPNGQETNGHTGSFTANPPKTDHTWPSQPLQNSSPRTHCRNHSQWLGYRITTGVRYVVWRHLVFVWHPSQGHRPLQSQFGSLNLIH